MEIKLATVSDIPALHELFDTGRQRQQNNGFTQWGKGYPAETLILEDIEREAAYICLNDDGEMIGAISVFTDPDPTYFEIEGEWLNEEPYASVHRIVTNGQVKGLGQYLLRWVQWNHDNIRIDTHKQNGPMKYILNKLDFEYCGIIYLENNEARNAYHYVATH